jgi:hypothetical protein
MKYKYLRKILQQDHFHNGEIFCSCCVDIGEWRKAQFYGITTNIPTCCHHANIIEKKEIAKHLHLRG